MKELEARGIVERHVREGSPVRVEYALTDMGRELAPALASCASGHCAGSARALWTLVQRRAPTPSSRLRRRSWRRRATHHAEDVHALVRETRRPLHPAVVHRHPRPAQVLLDQRAGARGRLRGRHGLRRLLHHRLQRDRGVRHDRDAGPVDLRAAAVAARGRRRRGRADVRRHPDPGARALRGRPAPRPAPRRGAREGDGLRPLLRRPGARVLPLPRQQGHRGPRRGRLLRPHDARRGLRRAPRDRARAREARASTWSTPTTRSARPSTRSTCATPTR